MILLFARRLLGIASVLLAMIVVVFLLQQVVPADPARMMAGPNAPAEVVAQKRAELGLDRPILTQLVGYLGRVARGDLGLSIRTNQPVRSDLMRLLPASLELIVCSLTLGAALGLMLSLISRQSAGAGPFGLVLLAGASAPIFLVAMLLLIGFWFELGWLPGSGRLSPGVEIPRWSGFMLLDALLSLRLAAIPDILRHLAMPALTLSLPVAVAFSRSMRSSLIAVMRQNHIRTARAKGLSEFAVVTRHGLRNALQAPMAMLGLQLGMTFANILVVERIFGWPGLGLYMVQALAASDLPCVLGVSLAFATLYAVVTLLIDIVQGIADPRLRGARPGS